ncbi:hypothetical protein [Halobacillus litoralis]|uniref:hypothetical protein n=1 Tax=Halobacillus litoralis TaxID=45668 RepID=UPI001CFE49AC|nr:hypothetical protein [Halobacillus litoralis]
MSKSQVLKNNSEADYVQLEHGEVYTHGVGWIEEKEWSKGERLGIVEEGMASHLPQGAVLYRSKETPVIIIAEYGNKTKRYLFASGE